jgi:hypothetical protein
VFTAKWSEKLRCFQLSTGWIYIQDIPQLAISVRYVTNDGNVKEFLNLISLKETTKGIDIKNALNKALLNAQLPLHKLVSIAADGAPPMVGKNTGLVGQLRQDPQLSWMSL